MAFKIRIGNGKPKSEKTTERGGKEPESAEGPVKETGVFARVKKPAQKTEEPNPSDISHPPEQAPPAHKRVSLTKSLGKQIPEDTSDEEVLTVGAEAEKNQAEEEQPAAEKVGFFKRLTSLGPKKERESYNPDVHGGDG